MEPADVRSSSDAVPPLTTDQRRVLLEVARCTLEQYLRDGSRTPRETDKPALLEKRAAFVTLRDRASGELRGCRGECVARRPLIESVAHTAIASATDDPRFPPVAAAELEGIAIEISALTPLEGIVPDDVEVGRHGLMIVRGGQSGLLLPQVPVEYGWDRLAFLTWVCRKAGLPDDAWQSPDAQLFGFESESWGEED